MNAVLARNGLTVCLSAVFAAMAAPAAAAIVTTGPFTFDSSNVGAGTSLSASGPAVTDLPGSRRINQQSSTTFQTSTEIAVAPTETTPGLRNTYVTPVTLTTWTDETWKQDRLSFGVDVNGGVPNFSGGKWISVAGSVSASEATVLDFYLRATGQFNASATPFGPAVPLLAAFYFGQSVAQPVPDVLASSNLSSLSYDSRTFSSTYSPTRMTLAAGQTESFIAYVYAGNDVSLRSFDLFSDTQIYDLATTPGSLTVTGERQLLLSDQIAPIPELDPAVILASGLGLVGLIARRRRAARGPVAVAAA